MSEKPLCDDQDASRAALVRIREHAIKLRNEYLSGARLVMLVVNGSNANGLLHANMMLDGPIGVLNEIIGKLHDELRDTKPVPPKPSSELEAVRDAALVAAGLLDEARETNLRLHRRVQEAEALVGLAMRVGLATVEGVKVALQREIADRPLPSRPARASRPRPRQTADGRCEGCAEISCICYAR